MAVNPTNCVAAYKAALKAIQSRLKDNPKLSTQLNELFQEMGDAAKAHEAFTARTGKTLPGLLQQADAVIADVVDSTVRRESFLKRSIDRFKDATNRRGIMEGLDAALDELFIAKQRGFTKHSQIKANAFKQVIGNKGRFSAREVQVVERLYDEHLTGGPGLIREFEKAGIIGDEARYAATLKMLHNGTFDGNKKLGILADALKKMKEQTQLERIKLDPLTDTRHALLDHMPFRPDRDKLIIDTKDNFMKFMRDEDVYRHMEQFKHVKDPKDINKQLSKFYDEMTEPNPIKRLYKDVRDAQATTPFRFQMTDEGLNAQRKFLTRYRRKDSDALIQSYLKSSSLLEGAEVYNVIGSDIVRTMNHLGTQTKAAKNKLKIDVQDISVDTKINAGSQHMASDIPLGISQESRAAIKAGKTFVGAILTTKSAVRNMLMDGVILPATGRLAMGQGMGESIMEGLANIGKMLQSINPSDTHRVSLLRQYYEDLGVQVRMSTHLQLQGHATNVQLANKLQTGGERAATGLAKHLNKWTAADWSYYTTKAIARESQGKLMMRSFDQGWEGITPQLQKMLNYSGIDEAAFNVMRQVKKEVSPWSGKHFDIKNFEDLTAAQLKGVRKAGESLDNTRARMKSLYQNFMDEIGNDHIAFVTGRDQLASFAGHEYGEVLNAFGLQFLAITRRSWQAQRRNFNRIAGINPADPITMGIYKGMSSNPKAMGMALAHTMTASMMYVWLKDLTEGRTPRDLTPQSAVDALGQIGVGGYYGILYNNLVYNRPALGTTATGITRPVISGAKAAVKGDGEKVFNAARQVALPWTHMWWTKLAADYAIEKGMGISPREKQAWYKRVLKEQGAEYQGVEGLLGE